MSDCSRGQGIVGTLACLDSDRHYRTRATRCPRGHQDDRPGQAELKRPRNPVELPPTLTASPELEEELIGHCREHLAGFKTPDSIDFEEKLSRHPTGKLLKRLLRDRYWEETGRSIQACRKAIIIRVAHILLYGYYGSNENHT